MQKNSIFLKLVFGWILIAGLLGCFANPSEAFDPKKENIFQFLVPDNSTEQSQSSSPDAMIQGATEESPAAAPARSIKEEAKK